MTIGDIKIVNTKDAVVQCRVMIHTDDVEGVKAKITSEALRELFGWSFQPYVSVTGIELINHNDSVVWADISFALTISNDTIKHQIINILSAALSLD